MQRLETIVQYVVVGLRHEFWRAEVTMAELDGRAFIMRQPASQSRSGWTRCYANIT